MTFGEKLKQIRMDRNMSQNDFANILGTSKQVISRYELGQTTPKISVVSDWCQILGINLDNMINDSKEIYDESIENKTNVSEFPHPRITDDYVTFPVIGDAAAGFDHIAIENWSGETVDIPSAHLHGRPASDYIVLNVHGDSMYPFYLDGDKVLVLLTPTLSRSGQIGVIRYDGEMATLKKVEYVDGEDWMRLIPINPEFKPKTITGSDLEMCEVIGIPTLLIREIEQ